MLKLSAAQHANITFCGMALIAAGLPLSVFLVSIGNFVLAANWLLERNFRERLARFVKDPLSMMIISIYLLHVIGMVYTQNWDQGMKELRLKLPIVLMPLLLFTSKMPNRKRIQDVLLIFVVACVMGSVLSMAYFLGHDDAVMNKRSLSVFISHIRFGLMLCLAIFILVYYLSKKWTQWSITEKVVTIFSILWLFYFMILLEAGTAFLVFPVLVVLSLLRALIRSKSLKLKFLTAGLIILGGLVSSIYLYSLYQNFATEIPFDYRSLTVKTANGRYYSHQKDVPYRENGHRVWNFVCFDELANEWPKRSTVPFEGKDHQGQPIKFTLVRYLTSKGLLKDSVGVHQLKTKDIENIELGFTNCNHTDKWGVSQRIVQSMWEIEAYNINGNANNSSLIQRWVYFKLGLSIVAENPLIGVGTGDLFEAYKHSYAEDDQGLSSKRQGASHNQFLTIAIKFGLIGLIVFLVGLFYPLRYYYRDYLYLMFFALIITSFLTDNTLASQPGATLFAFFNALLIVRKEYDEVDAPL